jgi:hypothetical protein
LTCEFVLIQQSSSDVYIGSYRNVICAGMCTPKSPHARQVSLAGDTQERLAGKRIPHVLNQIRNVRRNERTEMMTSPTLNWWSDTYVRVGAERGGA